MLARSLWLALALVALGLWASLVPQVTYTSASSGEPGGDVLVAWPGWGVQQDLGHLNGTVGRFQIWLSSAPAGHDVTVQASLVDASTREVLRQTFIEATPSYIPVARTLTFPSYDVPEGQRLLLQLLVQLPERYTVIYRLAAPGPGFAKVMLNGVPDSGAGPLAFAHLETGSGLRAAWLGDPSGRLRFALAVMFSVLSILAHPRVMPGLRRMGTAGWRLARLPATSRRRLVRPHAEREVGESPTLFGRVLATPWYPWPAAAIPILHFLASNPLHFAPIEAVVPLGIALVVVTASVVSLRFGLKDWHRPAAASAAVTVVFFGYGHVEGAFDGNVDERVLLAGAAVLGAAAVVAIVQTGAFAARSTQFLNLVSVVLLVFPVADIAGRVAESLGRTQTAESVGVDDLAAHLLPSGLPTVSDDRPDIYYIILDSYSRHDDLGDFDNSSFLHELGRRGFYVASEATSNYPNSRKSITSSLNMAYLDGLGQRTPEDESDLINIAHNHALGAILKDLGYIYIHLNSGYIHTGKAPLADIFISFSPAGIFVNELAGKASIYFAESDGMIVSRAFVNALIETTALQPIVGHRFLFHENSPYSFSSPHLTIKMFDLLTNPIDLGEGPKFVFAHINKPHGPASFDRHGNLVSGRLDKAFSDLHDPSVPDAYIGQVIYINTLTLEAIDGITRNSTQDPIIVIAADHGYYYSESNSRYRILAAFHLPEGGNDALYPSISSVNHFRYILDYYFDLNLGLLEDRIVED